MTESRAHNNLPKAGRVMLLIDADNVSADVIEQALDLVLAEHGAVHVRRAYCTAESALALQKLFKALSIRPIVNLSSGKNANDIALAIDAMDLAVAERPDVAVIVSSDSDFAPLVIRLREKGCRVLGIGQQGKTGEDSKAVYDHFIDFPHRRAKTASPSRRSPAEPRAKASARRTAAAPARAPSLPSAPAPAPTLAVPADVERILAHLPELRAGDKLELRVAAERLREAELLTQSGASTKLFRKYADWFALTPERQPNKVRYLGTRGD